jgi:hypothetical protein
MGPAHAGVPPQCGRFDVDVRVNRVRVADPFQQSRNRRRSPTLARVIASHWHTTLAQLSRTRMSRRLAIPVTVTGTVGRVPLSRLRGAEASGTENPGGSSHATASSRPSRPAPSHERDLSSVSS